MLLINYCLTTIVVLDLHGRYDVSRPHRRASDLLLRYVCLSVNHNREAYKTAKPIKMLFGLWTRMGSRNHVVVGESRIHPRKGVFFGGGIFQLIVKYREYLAFDRYPQSDSVGDSSDAAFRYYYCSNLYGII